MNIQLLDRLRAVPGEYVPLEELGPDLEQVRGDLTSLVSFGFVIEQHPYRGASYVGPAERLCPDQIEHELATRWVGRRIVVWNRVTSTNDLAARAGTSRSNDGLVVLAEEQTSGRGRRGRSWMAPPKSSILMSVVLFPPSHLMPGDSTDASGRAWLTALGAIATAEVVSSWTGRRARIKWPNDVRVEGRKIAGILVERALAAKEVTASEGAGAVRVPREAGERVHPGEVAAASGILSEPACGAVIGIGLNANLLHEDFPPELGGLATSLQIERGGAPVDRSELARDLVRALDHWYDLSRASGPESLNAAWCWSSEHLHRLVKVATASEDVVGRLLDLDVRRGVTLDRSAVAGTLGALPGHQKSSIGGGKAQLSRLAKLPLGEIRSIETLHEDRVPPNSDPDSWDRESGSNRPTLVD